MAEPLVSLKDLAARVKRLEDERDIRASIEQYGHSIDYGREADWVDVFTPDGVFNVRLPMVPPGMADSMPFAQVDSGGFKLVGSKALAAFAAMHSRPPTAYHKHVVADFVVTFDDDDHARVTTYAFRIDGLKDRREILAFGRHLDKVVRCRDGRWRIAERYYEMESTGGKLEDFEATSPAKAGA